MASWLVPSRPITWTESPTSQTTFIQFPSTRIRPPSHALTRQYIPEMFTQSSQWYVASHSSNAKPLYEFFDMNPSWFPLRRRLSPRRTRSSSGGHLRTLHRRYTFPDASYSMNARPMGVEYTVMSSNRQFAQPFE